MTRSRSMWLAAIILAAPAGGAIAADQPLVFKAPAAADEKPEYGNLYFGYDWTSHHSLAVYTGVLYAPGWCQLPGSSGQAVRPQQLGAGCEDGLQGAGRSVGQSDRADPGLCARFVFDGLQHLLCGRPPWLRFLGQGNVLRPGSRRPRQ